MRLICSIIFLILSDMSLAQQTSEDFQSIPVTHEKAGIFTLAVEYGNYTITELQTLYDEGDVSAGTFLSLELLKDQDQTTREKGLEILLSAARLGFADLQHRLANEYWYGRTVPRDQNLAILWYRQSLRGGDMTTAGIWANKYDPQSTMFKEDGTLLQPDIAVQPDQVKSLMWQLVAFKMGYPASSYDVIIPRYRSELTKKEFSTAEEMADRCFNSSFEACGWQIR